MPKVNHNNNCGENLTPRADWQTQCRGTNTAEYEIYLACADDGNGGDSTRNGAPLKTFEEWLST